MYVYHFYAESTGLSVDGIVDMEKEIKSFEDYTNLKDLIKVKFNIAIGQKIIIKSLTKL